MAGHGHAASAMSVLLVEDDTVTRREVSRNLAAHGYRVVETGTVAEALPAKPVKAKEPNKPPTASVTAADATAAPEGKRESFRAAIKLQVR